MPATDTQYKFSPYSELNMEQLQIIMVMLACVPGIPVVVEVLVRQIRFRPGIHYLNFDVLSRQTECA